MLYFWVIFFFTIGSTFGSFLSVLIFRIKENKKGIVMGRSSCPACHKNLEVRDMIPIFSYLANKGNCRFCGKSISIIYPTLEIVSGLLTVFNSFHLLGIQTMQQGTISMNSWLNFFLLTAVTTTLIAIAFYDLITKEIPNIFLYFWIGICTASTLYAQQLTLYGVIGAIAIILFLLGGQILISKGKWLGSGDLYFGFGMAVLLGLEKTLVAIILSYVIGSIISILLLLFKILKPKSTIPFAPFLAIGTIVSLYFGNQIFIWYTNFSLFNLPT